MLSKMPPEPSNKLFIASQNSHKIQEMRSYLQPIGYQLFDPASEGLDFDVEETGTTFAENATLKSKALFQMSGHPAFADDSGICVVALDNRPGVFSARYGSPGMNDKDRAMHLLTEMQGQKNRDAYYYCAISYTNSEGTYLFESKCEGQICEDYDEIGQFGFGYDPIFFYPPFGQRFSQVELAKKNSVSHRGLALQKFLDFLKQG